MTGKKIIAILLLATSLCLAPAAGYGEVVLAPRIILGETAYDGSPLWDEVGAMDTEIGLLRLDINLLKARVNYMMLNPTTFLFVTMSYDREGTLADGFFPPGVLDTEGMVCLLILDNLDVFAQKSGASLLEEFRRQLEIVYSFMDHIATDMDADIVAEFDSREGIPLGYFYRGEYRLWEEKQF